MNERHVKLTWRTGLLTAIASIGNAHLVPQLVRAEDALVICTGTDTTTFSPGLRLFPRESATAWSDEYPVCISTEFGIIQASSPGAGYTAELSCLDILSNDPSDGSQRIDWSTGDYSIFAWEASDVTSINALGQQTTTVNATIVEGLYVGHRLVEVVVAPEPKLLDCLFEPGLTNSTGVITLQVLPL